MTSLIYLRKVARMLPGESPGSIARALQTLKKGRDVESPEYKWARYLDRRILVEAGRNPDVLDTFQRERIRAIENGEGSIWQGEVRSIAAFGNRNSVD